MGWVVSVTHKPRWIGGWVGLRAGLDTEAGGKIHCLCRESNPVHPVCSQTLYWLSYPSTLGITINYLTLLKYRNVKVLSSFLTKYVISVNRAYLIVGAVVLLLAAVLITLLLWCIEQARKDPRSRKLVHYILHMTYYAVGPQEKLNNSGHKFITWCLPLKLINCS
jgi:hypothetical protein